MSLSVRHTWARKILTPVAAVSLAVSAGVAALPAGSSVTPAASGTQTIHAAMADSAEELGLPPIDSNAAATADAQAAATGGSVYKPVTPARVLDTRIGLSGTRLGARQAHTFNVLTPEVLASAGLDASTASTVTAVEINMTVTGSDDAGFVTVWPGGQNWPGSSNLNMQRAGQTVANLVTTPVAPGGDVQVLANSNTDMIADVQGVYVAASGAQTAGRFVALRPTRVVDTRLTGNPLQAGVPVDIDLAGAGISIPADATAVALNVTSVIAPAIQYLTIWPFGEARPVASNLYLEYGGQTLANAVIAGVADGKVSVVATAGGHLVIDVAGYFTGSSAASSTEGLFQPLTPTRIADTREATGPTGGRRPLPGEVIGVPVAGRSPIPSSGVAALTLNLTATETSGPGFVTVYPSRTERPGTSSVTPERVGQTLPNQVVSPVSTDGMALFTAGGSHLVIDVNGYFTGTAVPTTQPPVAPSPLGDVKPAAQPSSPPSTGPYTLMYTVTGGYARWNPCAILRYAINADRASTAQLALLDDVVHEAEAATGIDFVFVGYTSAGLDGTPPPGADVVLAFTDQTASPQLGSAVGLGGGSFVNLGGGTGRVIRGFAIFVADYGTSTYQRELMLHEIAHTLGLGHVNDPSEVMNPYVVNVPHYAGGDSQGLWMVGAAQGCIATGASYAPGDNSGHDATTTTIVQ